MMGVQDTEMLVADVALKLRRLLRESRGALKASEISDIDVDLVVVYVAAATRALVEWLSWEAACKDKCIDAPPSYCSDVEQVIKRRDPGYGVVSYFNTELKKLLVRLVRDFSPGIAVPSWVGFYSAFRLRDPVALHLAGLGPLEQILRVPAYASAVRLLDAVSHGLEEYYSERGAAIAATTAAYVHWELIRPLSLLADALEKLAETDGMVTEVAAIRQLALRTREDIRRTGAPTSIASILREMYNNYASIMARMLRNGI